MSRIISYRGLLADGGQDTINLHTNDGKTGYKVVKFQVMTEKVSTVSVEHTLKIYKTKQSTVDEIVDFNDITLLGAAITMSRSDAYNAPVIPDIIFDGEIFNQDIYVTHKDNLATQSCNYYIELEQIDLTEDQALVAIVKNLRNEQ